MFVKIANLFAWGWEDRLTLGRNGIGKWEFSYALGKRRDTFDTFLIEYLSNESFTCLHPWHTLSTLRNLFLYRYHIHAHFNFKKLEASLMPINKELLSGVSCCHGSKRTTAIHVNTHHCFVNEQQWQLWDFMSKGSSERSRERWLCLANKHKFQLMDYRTHLWLDLWVV